MRLAPLAIAAGLALTACSTGGGADDAQTPSEAAASEAAVEVTPNVGVQLFQYNWNSVAKQCTEVLGPNHFEFVLLSPAQEHITGEQWWTSYQPVSYQLESKLGTRAEFEQMVSTCHDAGVKIVADAVVNHMAGIDGGTGFAGTEFQHYEYPGLYGHDDFHHCGLTENDDIANYSDQQQVQECELENLADLRTDSEKVQETLAGYLNDLVSLGVDGFRIDAAKHMAHADVAAIVGRIDGDPMIISEVIRSSGEPVQPEDYLDIGDVFAFGWAKDVGGIIKGGSLRLALELRDGEVPSEQAYTFVTNHDTERNRQTLSYKDGDVFRQAEMLAMATDYGTPILYSGYAFSDRDTGAPSTDGVVDDVVCATGEEPADGEFVCIDEQLAAMASWRAHVGDGAIGNQVWEQSVLSFDRGDRGLVAISSHSSKDQEVTLSTAMPDGTYCDVLSDACDVEVADGKVTLTVPHMGAVALHVGARAES